MTAEPKRTLVAGVGNVLCGDDGFGVAVARQLLAEGGLPAGVDLIETGIGGMSIVQELMAGYDALIIADAVDCGLAPGAVFVLDPEVPDPAKMAVGEWQAHFSNLHLAEPSRIFMLARAIGVLPHTVRLVGCQPQDCAEIVETLSPPVQAAVAIAAEKVRELALSLTCIGMTASEKSSPCSAI